MAERRLAPPADDQWTGETRDLTRPPVTKVKTPSSRRRSSVRTSGANGTRVRAGTGAASEVVIQHVVQRIRSGRYSPAQRLIEADLVRETGVSRNSVREALRWLEASGFVDFEPNKGAAVRALSRKEARDVLVILEALTHLAIAEVISQIHEPAVRQKIEDSLVSSRAFKELARSALPLTAVCAEHVRFHDALHAVTGNRMLAEVRERLRIHILPLEWQGLASDSVAIDWTHGHEEVLLAILDGDLERAISFKQRGLRQIRDAVLSLGESEFG